jgi:hypothetical protein
MCICCSKSGCTHVSNHPLCGEQLLNIRKGKVKSYKPNAIIKGDTMSSDFDSVNINDAEKEKQEYDLFKVSFTSELCAKYKDLSKNKGLAEFEFNIEDIPKQCNEGGFGLRPGTGNELSNRLLKFEKEYGYIQVLLDKGMFRLTRLGIKHCRMT